MQSETEVTVAALAESKLRAFDYEDFITEAADLVSEHGENGEYDRALYELGARLFAVRDMPTDDRASWIEYDIRSRRPITPE